MSLTNRAIGYHVDELRRDLREDDGPAMQRRRGVIVASLAGIAAMSLTALLQTGVVRRLPDPPIRRFDTRGVILSDEAFGYGGPDSPMVILMHAVDMVLASIGGADRARRAPLVPIAAAVVAGAKSGMAAKYLFYQMPYAQGRYCPYCIAGALVHFTTFGLTLPEAVEATRELLNPTEARAGDMRVSGG